MKRCSECGRTVMWHRVFKTRAGVRAFCDAPSVPRRPKHRAALSVDAADVWSRLHEPTKEGEQGSLL